MMGMKSKMLGDLMQYARMRQGESLKDKLNPKPKPAAMTVETTEVGVEPDPKVGDMTLSELLAALGIEPGENTAHVEAEEMPDEDELKMKLG